MHNQITIIEEKSNVAIQSWNLKIEIWKTSDQKFEQNRCVQLSAPIAS